MTYIFLYPSTFQLQAASMAAGPPILPPKYGSHHFCLFSFSSPHLLRSSLSHRPVHVQRRRHAPPLTCPPAVLPPSTCHPPHPSTPHPRRHPIIHPSARISPPSPLLATGRHKEPVDRSLRSHSTVRQHIVQRCDEGLAVVC
jgi:hypothetical protein